MGQQYNDIYVPSTGEKNWTQGGELNDGLELLAKRSAIASDDGQTLEATEISSALVNGATITSLLGANISDDGGSLAVLDADIRAAVEGESDVADLSGADGTADQVAQTDGANVSWVDLPSGTTDTRIDVADSGGVVVSEPDTMTVSASGDASVTVSDDGSGGVTVDVSATDTDTDTNTQAFSLAASGSTTLSSGAGTVDTGVSTDSDHYDVNVNPGSADIAVSLDGSGSNYVIHFEENSTSVGNPTVDYQLLRSEL
jgi:hypothetical protein